MLPDVDAKYPVFNSTSFNSICIGMKPSSTGAINWLLLPNITDSSLRNAFASWPQTKTAAGANKWKAMMGYPRMQRNCNLEGFNLRSRGEIYVRIGFMANNQRDCRSPDSFIGIGLLDISSEVSAGYIGFKPRETTSAMAYIVIQ